MLCNYCNIHMNREIKCSLLLNHFVICLLWLFNLLLSFQLVEKLSNKYELIESLLFVHISAPSSPLLPLSLCLSLCLSLSSFLSSGSPWQRWRNRPCWTSWPRRTYHCSLISLLIPYYLPFFQSTFLHHLLNALTLWDTTITEKL